MQTVVEMSILIYAACFPLKFDWRVAHYVCTRILIPRFRGRCDSCINSVCGDLWWKRKHLITIYQLETNSSTLL